MEKRVLSAKMANVHAGDMFHRFVELNTFGLAASLPRKEFTPIWQPPRLLKDFVGREQDLDDLQQFFTHRPGTAVISPATKVSGTGGIGKTQLAIVLFHRLKALGHYEVLIWFNKDLSTEFRRLAHSLGIEIKGVSNSEVAQRTYIELSRRGRVLMVIDDADREEYFEHYCPPKNLDISMLLTTRDATSWGANIHSHMLGVFTLDESKEYIRRKFESHAHGLRYDDKEAEDLASTVGNFPLALSQAVAYIVKHRCSVPEYIARFHSKTKSALSERFENDPYKQYVWVTVNLSLETIQNEGSLIVMNACAYLAPEAAIPKAIVQSYLSKEHAGYDADHCLQELSSLSLIAASEKLEFFTLHQIVQDVLKFEKPAIYKREKILRLANCIINLIGYDDSTIKYSQHLKFSPHIVVLIHELSLQPREKVFLQSEADLNNLIGVINYNSGDGNLATVNFERQLCCLRQIPNSDKMHVAVALMGIGVSKHSIGDYYNSEQNTREAVTIFEELNTDNDVLLAKCFMDLGCALSAQGKAHEAKVYFHKALPMLRIYFPGHALIAMCLVNLGIAELGLVDIKQAMLHQQEALSIMKDSLGPNHRDVGRCMIDLGITLTINGFHEDAEKMLEAGANILKVTVKKHHPMYGKYFMSLGIVALFKKDYCTAINNLKQALPILETLVENHLELGTCNLSSGMSEFGNKNYEEAIRYFNIGFQIVEKKNIKILDVIVGECMMLMGISYVQIRNTEVGKQYLLKALPMLKLERGSSDERVGLCLLTLGQIAYESGLYAESISYLEECLPICKNYRGENDVIFLQIKTMLSEATNKCSGTLTSRISFQFRRFFSANNTVSSIAQSFLAKVRDYSYDMLISRVLELDWRTFLPNSNVQKCPADF